MQDARTNNTSGARVQIRQMRGITCAVGTVYPVEIPQVGSGGFSLWNANVRRWHRGRIA